MNRQCSSESINMAEDRRLKTEKKVMPWDVLTGALLITPSSQAFRKYKHCLQKKRLVT